MSDLLCSETVNRGHGRWYNPQPCGRKVVADGLCSLHLKVRDRRAAKDEGFEKRMIESERLKAEADELTLALGVTITAEFSSFTREYTGNFVVPADWLRGVAK